MVEVPLGYLRAKNPCWVSFLRPGAFGRNNCVDSKASVEGGGEMHWSTDLLRQETDPCSPCRLTVEQKLPCSLCWRPCWGRLSPYNPWKSTVEQISICDPWSIPYWNRWLQLRKAIMSKDAHTRAACWWEDYTSQMRPTWEKAVPEHLYSMEGTHAGALANHSPDTILLSQLSRLGQFWVGGMKLSKGLQM